MKLNKRLVLAFVSTLIVTACVTVPTEPKVNKNQIAISSVRDIPISYAAGSQFSLSPKYVKETSLKPTQTQAVYTLYADEIVNDLTEHGFISIDDASKATFHVGFGLALTSDLSDDKINEKFGVTPGLPDNEDFKKASFLIYIEDAATGKKVWRGAAQGFAHEELDEKQKQTRAQGIVKRVMKQFYYTN